MKQLTCEMCGSTDLIKQDGVFVCQACGCKYSVEEAKKLMIEGTVDVSGSTVKVDSSEELNNLFELARRAKNNSDSANAKLYYTRILEKQPSNWEAAFYSMYFTATSTTLGQLENNTINVSNGLDSIASLILQLPEDEQVAAKNEFRNSILQLHLILMDGVLQKAKGYGDAPNALSIIKNSSSVVATLLIRAGDVFLTRFNDTENAKMFYKEIIGYKSLSKDVINTAIERIKIVDPSYTVPTNNAKSSKSNSSKGKTTINVIELALQLAVVFYALIFCLANTRYTSWHTVFWLTCFAVAGINTILFIIQFSRKKLSNSTAFIILPAIDLGLLLFGNYLHYGRNILYLFFNVALFSFSIFRYFRFKCFKQYNMESTDGMNQV